MNASAPSYIREEDDGSILPYSSLANLRRYRFALLCLILKDFRVRYRNMSLGMLWSVINPLVMLGVLVVVFSFIHPNHHAAYFPVFMLIGLVVYSTLALCLPPATSAILDNAALVKKVIFPRELIPLAVVLSQWLHVGIQFLLLLVFAFIFSVPVQAAWLWIPVVYLVLFVFVTGLGFGCAALDVAYRDMLYVVESALKVLFWLTPIFYDLPQVKLNLPRPLYRVYLLNPMAGCIDALRAAMLRGESPDPEALLIATAVSALVFLGGWTLFHRRHHRFADQI